jgi:hypothetical protein
MTTRSSKSNNESKEMLTLFRIEDGGLICIPTGIFCSSNADWKTDRNNTITLTHFKIIIIIAEDLV